ncbi:MAG: hypothetical protein DI536_08545 [Archangium gephyra]|uniref:Fatty acid hydroxylase domain-containing protein n=1 Tax=Archangium gephyra TaxID=48 RepID=A0A2W5TNT0_9BACT|nr:MAG: hypothetical protein DI536_08545 [Archangium gephyra]
MNANLWRQRLSNYACGALTALVSLTAGSLVLGVYALITKVTPLAWGESPLAYVAAFIAVDFLYYWQHRGEHRSPMLWAIHEVHHQATHCDASVSLRTSVLSPLSVLSFHLVLAAAGVPLKVYLPVYAVHVALIFLLHTKLPSALNRAGWVFNSPYLHRAHHSNHPGLRGKNLGGVFIVWDRLFGTFEAACDEATTFGIGQREVELNPVLANVRPVLRWWRRAGRQGA